jgi:hypothetical protein
MGLRAQRHGESLYVLSGIGVRLARKMGLHIDGSMLGLSPFETELRRRLWHHIFNADCGIADFIGTKPSLDVILSDTKPPLNIEDEDLYPDMESAPPERNGITTMALRLIKYDVMSFFKDSMPDGVYTSNDLFHRRDVSMAEKDRKISQLEDLLERKYLRYCDPSESLHFFVSILCRVVICNMRVLSHMRSRHPTTHKVSQKERDVVIKHGLKLLEYVNLIQTSPMVRKYIWQIGNSQIWLSIVCVLLEARNRKTGSEVDRIWEQIEGIFSQGTKCFPKPREQMYSALSSWMVQVWEDCAAARQARGLPAIAEPEYITTIRRSRKARQAAALAKIAEQKAGNGGSSNEAHIPPDSSLFAPIGLENESLDFTHLQAFEMDPNEWSQWERMFSTESYYSMGS